MRISDKTSYLIAIFATIVRYYDYALFGLSASVIAGNFMPGDESSDKLLNFFMVFSVSVAARPIGSIIFGRISDKIGRVASVRITVIISVLSVMLIAVLPRYEVLGICTTIILVLARMLFIMSLAGEVDAIKVYVAEKIGKKSRHLASSIVSFSAQLGVLVAACMYHFTLGITEITWLWRINFVIGGVFGLLVFFLRKSLHESSYYMKSKLKDQNRSNLTLIAILLQNKIKFLLAMILSGGIGASYNFLIIFLSTFIANVKGDISSYDAAQNNIILIIVYGISCLFSGILADRVPVYKQIFISLILAMFLVLKMQLLVEDNVFFFPIHLAIVFFVPMYMIPIQIKLQSMFSADTRVRMSSLSHSVGSMILSATIPFVCMLLWKYTESFSAVCLYFTFILLLIACSAFVIMKVGYQNMFETF